MLFSQNNIKGNLKTPIQKCDQQSVYIYIEAVHKFWIYIFCHLINFYIDFKGVLSYNRVIGVPLGWKWTPQ